MAGPSFCSSSSRTRSSSPFSQRRPLTSSHSSSSSSASSFMNGRLFPRSSPSSVSSHFYGSGGVTRSVTPNRGRCEYSSNHAPIGFVSADENVMDAGDAVGSGDSITVTVRFRPLSEREFQRGDEIAWYADGDKMARCEYNPATAYAFDRVFGPSTTSQVIYDVAARPVVKAAMEGINGTVFAYGVTSSGKTHTMHGDQNCPGIIPLAIKDVFSIIQDTPGREFLLRVSYLEIYNEVINDLLDPTGQNLRVREDAQGTYVEGIKDEVVLSPGHALSFIAAGEEHRHVGSNNFNLFSSRSHTIFTLMIESSARGDEYDGVMYSQLNLIDLAGSESSKTETTGQRRKEGSFINKSLLTLGTVIGKLSEGRATHIPYRDSKLTRLLQSSLSGHGLVSLICTVTPASSNMEETHNTLKFASRAKRVEIYASRNRIIDEKSLIKKYQREISNLKQELEQLKRGMLTGVGHEEIMSLKQKLEEGQVKMQSRLEEEEEAKAALMSRIQRLTKLILVSTKNTIPGRVTDLPGHQAHCSLGGDESGISMADQIDLLEEQVKMVTGEIALNNSTLKRLVEQSAIDPENSKIQIQNLEREIEEKRNQMRVLEQRIIESKEASIANASLFDMQQTVTRLMTQCNEKGFELEIKSADNRILQEQLNKKCAENNELQEKLLHLQQQLNPVESDMPSFTQQQKVVEEIGELECKLQLKEFENKKLSLERTQLVEQNHMLLHDNQNLSEEASYAKELASAAAAELKNLTEEVTKLSLQNARLTKEFSAVQEVAFSRSAGCAIRKHSENRNEGVKLGRKGRQSSRVADVANTTYDDTGSWNLDLDDMRMKLQAMKQREASLEAALAEKEILEEEYCRKFDESKKREAALENDLAGMWVLVAKLKKGVLSESELNVDAWSSNGVDVVDDQKENKNECGYGISKDLQLEDKQIVPLNDQFNHNPVLEPMLSRLKARIQEMKEKELYCLENDDKNSHICKVCFESATAAVLLPCRHFCLCKPCSFACSECPLCRTVITDRIITFTS
ncbi:kinesin-like protein KIN-7K, chloroplastic isoform X2 [Phalaenopsis equestris]|uniref:kinesin-like protein KIN-7K, chloroplastic isoform X2 n=1 Tax=Phalaenopsis equestris TaxID=78828 RepID=UPI0009E32AE7|nr:kinesin-like protein KIN-7K, chloroplastic isoform X2 [Phalaenopsis equestris]